MSAIRRARYFALMADEVTGSSNKEQVVICFRSVMKMLLACTRWNPSRVEVLKNTMLRHNLPIRDC